MSSIHTTAPAPTINEKQHQPCHFSLSGNMLKSNKALDQLEKRKPKDLLQIISKTPKLEFVKKNCQSLWYLVFEPNIVNSFAEGIVFFNAAFASGFTKVFIIENEEDGGNIHPEVGAALTQQWKLKFKSTTGQIVEYQKTQFNTKGADWLVCQPKEYPTFLMETQEDYSPSVLPNIPVNQPVYFTLVRKSQPLCTYQDNTFTVTKTKHDNEYYFEVPDDAGRIEC